MMYPLPLRFPAMAVLLALMLGAAHIADAHEETPFAADVNEMSHRVAGRLQKRLAARGTFYEVHQLAEAVQMRTQLLKRSVVVGLNGEDTGGVSQWTVSLSEHADWMTFDDTEKPAFIVDDRRVRDGIEQAFAGVLPSPSHATIMSVSDGIVSRADMIGEPMSGYSIDSSDAGTRLATAFAEGTSEIVVDVVRENPTIFVIEDDAIRSLSLLSSGRSNFAGSSFGRRNNVRKAFLDHVQHAVIKPGEKFSFETVIDNPISGHNGWADAYVIVNGKDLALEPGGGICQAVTTVYRAALLAGLPVLKRANHSLYVTYYKEHGVGIDATFYPDKQDLLFENDTPGEIVLVSRVDGDDAFVDIYGVPDGRSVELNGPFFAQTAPEEFTVGERTLQRNEIAWTQIVTRPDGEAEENLILSRYLAIPKTLHEEYADTSTGSTLVSME